MEQDCIKTEELTVGYGITPVISDIAISLKKGEIVTLVGPNGAGKSTVLKSIANRLKMLGGKILIENMSLKDLSEKELAKKLAIVFTEKVEPELMTVEEVTALGRYPYTGGLGILSEKDKKKIKEVMEMVKISDLKDRFFPNLSDGQKQRVLLAKAICQEPEILVLDEPTSYLDVNYKLQFFSILQRMTREKKMGVLMSLHELELAEKVSDRVLCVAEGMVKGFGTPEEIFADDKLIKEVYGLTGNCYRREDGGVEMEKTGGRPEVFVIAGSQTGRFVYRMLQRKGIPFSTGILWENDGDCVTAHALAEKVISVKAFDEVKEETYLAAKEEMLSCHTLICCKREWRGADLVNQRLLAEAEAAGKNIEYHYGRE